MSDILLGILLIGVSISQPVAMTKKLLTFFNLLPKECCSINAIFSQSLDYTCLMNDNIWQWNRVEISLEGKISWDEFKARQKSGH